MPIPSQLRNVAFVAALVMPALPAMAQSGGLTTRLSQFSYELVDLNPSDGISPAVEFVLNRHEQRSAYASDYVLVAEDVRNDIGATEVVGPSGNARSSLSAGTWFAEANTQFGPSDHEFYSAFSVTYWTISLTPWTALNLEVLAENTATFAPELFLLAKASIQGNLYDSVGLWLGSIDQYHVGVGSAWLRGTVASGSTNATGNLYLAAESYAYTSPAVPEPATCLMLLAGLGMIGPVVARGAKSADRMVARQRE